ncbi:MAG: hypothetical protein DRQ88_12915 [Epsilonproteobacteria bacterium]|nr:MAG: hypothetical protein DRQ89_12965 [Campylobacterota bacterium]RLA63044.1 MAG: hypothetical protein DRQ88_12915 [Campylobacterota bacterium]
MKEGKTFNKRFEKKFLIDSDHLNDLLCSVESELFVKDHHDESTCYTTIENIYFDDDKLRSFNESILKSPNRKKLRIRSYAQNDKKEKFLFFEIKSKDNGQTLKSRIVFMEEWLVDFLDDGQLSVDALLKINKNKIKTLETLESIKYLIHEQNFKPVLKTSYKRFAFRPKFDSTVRVTVDTELKFERLRKQFVTTLAYKKKINKDQVIVEIKYKDKESLKNISKFTESLGKPSGFSKYCFGVQSSAQENFVEERQKLSFLKVAMLKAIQS